MSDNLRSKVIRLAHQQPSLRPHLLPLLGVRTAAKVKVITFGNRGSEYTEDELREFLDEEGGIVSRYKSADNLPKWLSSSKALRLRGWGQVAELIQKMIDSSGTVVVKVPSDKPFEHEIIW